MLSLFVDFANAMFQPFSIFAIGSSPGQAVYDPFLGSGTTIIAAELTGRAAISIEIAPAYVDVAVRRWQNFTGQQAVLDGDGRSLDQIAAERSPQTTAVDAA